MICLTYVSLLSLTVIQIMWTLSPYMEILVCFHAEDVPCHADMWAASHLTHNILCWNCHYTGAAIA
jgi:hypothetical protein